MLASGHQSPMIQKLGLELVEISRGHAVFEGKPDRRVYNPMGAVESAAHFPGCTVFGYRLPEPSTSHWALTETEVSIRCCHPNGRGDLEILVEKDFECLEPREGESQANRFQNPKAL